MSRDGRSLLIGAYDGTVRLAGPEGYGGLPLPAHGGVVRSVVVTDGDGAMLTASADQTARLFDATGTEILSFRRSGAEVNAAVLSPDGSMVATAHEDGAVTLWDVDVEGAPVLRGHDGAVRAVAWSPKGDLCVTASGNGRVLLWTAEGRRLRVLAEPSGTQILSAAFRGDGRGVLIGAWDGTVRALDLDGQELWSPFDSGGRVNAIDCLPDGRFLTANGEDRVARVWDRDRQVGGDLAGHGGDVTHAAFASDGVLTAAHDGKARLFPFGGGAPVVVLDHGERVRVMSAVESPDGRWLLTAASDRTARLWDRRGRPVKDIPHEAGLTNAAFSPDSRHVLTACRDGIARIWDLQGTLVAILRGHRGVVWRAAFSPDGKRVLTGSFDHTARLWLTDPADVIGLARRRVSRAFTAAERDRYAELLLEGR